MNIPLLGSDEQAHLAEVEQHLAAEILAGGGAVRFDRFMELALYAPGLGYYVAGSRKFGAAGDFVTAPEISPYFSRCLARQCAQVLDQVNGGNILEVGAGTGIMAADLLAELETEHRLPDHYCILELSPELQQRQRQTLMQKVPHLAERVRWLSSLPDPGFTGVVLGNELLDAMPVTRFRISDEGVQEQFVVLEEDRFQPQWRVTTNRLLLEAVEQIQQQTGPLANGYQSEVNLRLDPWLQELGRRVEQAAVILIDYGYSRREYYHPDRACGTLICHFRHQAHDDPFHLAGLQDITANVDFTAVAEAGVTAGFTLSGYTTQANFLLGCGLDKLLARSNPGPGEDYISAVQGVKTLTLPSEMGERFKVIALTRGIEEGLMGFDLRDLRTRL